MPLDLQVKFLSYGCKITKKIIKSRLSLIVRVNVVLNRIGVVDVQ